MGIEEDPVDQIKQPTLVTNPDQQPFQSNMGTPHEAPMQEINQMEVQFNNPS